MIKQTASKVATELTMQLNTASLIADQQAVNRSAASN
jgi:hypothetical protein